MRPFRKPQVLSASITHCVGGFLLVLQPGKATRAQDVSLLPAGFLPHILISLWAFPFRLQNFSWAAGLSLCPPWLDALYAQFPFGPSWVEAALLSQILGSGDGTVSSRLKNHETLPSLQWAPAACFVLRFSLMLSWFYLIHGRYCPPFSEDNFNSYNPNCQHHQG